MKKHTKIILLSILIAETTGALSAWLTREGMKTFTNMIAQPPLSPPPLLFPIVWSILYALMGYGSAKIWMSAPSSDRTRGLVLYASQLVFNFFWSLIFFNIQAFGFSFFWQIWGKNGETQMALYWNPRCERILNDDGRLEDERTQH